MPELPDLEAMKDVLQRRIQGQMIREVRVLRPTVLRVLQPGKTVESYLAGATLHEFGRRAKLLLIGLGDRGWCAIHLMYWGRLRLCPADEAVRVRDYLSLGTGKMDAADCLQRVGLAPEDYLERMVDKTLSGGERKRIELASVLALAPRLVILDEPTAGIDLLSIHEIIGVIGSFKASGAGVLLITHREEVTRVADRASQLCGGRIVCSGDPVTVAENYQGRVCRRCNGEECHDE